MTSKHPARGARIATGIATGLALVGMVGGYQAAEAAQYAVARQSAGLTTATVEPAPATPVAPAPAAAAPAPAPAAPAPAAPAPAPPAPKPAPAAPEPAPPAPAPVDGSTGGS